VCRGGHNGHGITQKGLVMVRPGQDLSGTCTHEAGETLTIGEGGSDRRAWLGGDKEVSND
jgi:hypothetical protein